jgi:pilus assembly protein CpaB
LNYAYIHPLHLYFNAALILTFNSSILIRNSLKNSPEFPFRNKLMKRSQALLLAASAVSALGSAAIIHGLLTHAFPSGIHTDTGSTIPILVAARNIAAGDNLEPGATVWRPWPRDSVMPAMIMKADAQTFSGAALTQYFARMPLLAGEPLHRDRLVKRGDASLLAALITPGMRAVPLPLREENGTAGLIRANDRVDVIVTRDRRAGGAGAGASETILRGVRVLAAGGPDEGAQHTGSLLKGPAQRAAALEVTPRQAELLAGARRNGEISLSLAAPGNAAAQDKPDGRRYAPLTIIKSGVAAKVTAD